MDLEQNRKTMNISEVEGDQPRLLSKENLLAELKLGDKKEINLNPSVPNNANKITPCTSPLLDSPFSGGLGLPIPKTIITKRTRTHSTNERAMKNPEVKGKIKHFSRTKGHGFIEHEDGEDIFVHISDIEGEFVPKVGDEVTYRLCPIPPKEEKYQATHVRIINFTPDVHMKWDAPLYDEEKSGSDSCSSPMK